MEGGATLRSMKKTTSGFTIVELLIVIVVIGILAAITIVAYNGVQARARDGIRKSDLSQMAKILKIYTIDNGDTALLNCGNGYSTSWLHVDYDGAGPQGTVHSCLPKPFRDPSGLNACGGAACHAYLKVTCADGNTYLFANLELEPQSASATNATCDPNADTNYGSNYILRI